MGFETVMGKIVVIFFISLLCSCTATNSFLIFNDTDKNVSVTVHFAVESPDKDDTFNLQPNQSEFWMYEQSAFASDTLYPQIESIKIVTKNNCEVVLKRTELEKIAKKEDDEWQWILDINENLLDACD